MKSVKILVSYSDPDEKHTGKIYQATNWLHVDSHRADTCMISFQNNPYKWIHPRSIFEKYGTTKYNELISILKKEYKKIFWTKKLGKKLKYIYILCNKTDKKYLLNNLKRKILQYPKTISNEDISIIKEHR